MPTRLEALKRAKATPPLPPNPLPHIIERFVEVGMMEAGGMAPVPLSWREINEWQAATCVHLSPWEARLIRRLSQDYVAELRRAESENAAAPWRAEPTAQERQTAEQQLRDVLG